MAADTGTETDTEIDTKSPQTELIEQSEHTSPTSETDPSPTTETQPPYQSRADHIRELEEYEANEAYNDHGTGSSDTVTPYEYSGSVEYVDPFYESRADYIRELDEYEENETDLGVESSSTITPGEYSDSGVYGDAGVDGDIEEWSPSEYRRALANLADDIGDTDLMIDSEQALDESGDDKADESQAAHKIRLDVTEKEPQGSEEPHPDPGDFLEPSADLDGGCPPDDESLSHNRNNLGDAHRVLDEKQPREDPLDETDSGVDSRPGPPSSIGDNSEAEPDADTYHDAGDTEPPAAADLRSSNNDEPGNADHMLGDERPADNNDLTIGLDSQHTSPETADTTNSDADKTNSDPAVDEIRNPPSLIVEDPSRSSRESTDGIGQGFELEHLADRQPNEPPSSQQQAENDATDATHADEDLPPVKVAQLDDEAVEAEETTQGDIDWEDNKFSSGVAQESTAESQPYSGDLLEKSDVMDAGLLPDDLSHHADGDAVLWQGQHPGAAEWILDNKKPLPVTHNDTQATSHLSSADIANGPASPCTGLASGTGQEAPLLANQALSETATDTHDRMAVQKLDGQPLGSTADIHQALSAEPDDAPHLLPPERNGAKQSEPAADPTVKNALHDSAAAFSTSQSEIIDGDPRAPVSTEIDNSVEIDSDTRQDTQDAQDGIDEQLTAQADRESALLGQSVHLDSVQAIQDDHLVEASDAILPQDDSTQVADTSEEFAESATDTPLEQTHGSGNTPVEDDENPVEDQDDVIRSSTDATADESDPDSQLNNDLERPKNPRDTSTPASDRHTCEDPIDIATGEMVLHQSDVELPGTLPLILTRTHVSSYRAGRSFGPSWASTLDQRLKIDEHGACYAAADGMLLVYPLVVEGMAVLPEEGPRWPLALTEEGTYTITDPQRGHTLHFTRPASKDPVLPLTAITDRNQHRIDFDYTPEGTPTQIRHSGGYCITIDTTDHRITALHLHDPATHTARTLIRYTYNSDNRLTEVINSSGLPLRFDYDTHDRITGWQDRNHTWYRYTYNQTGRCIHATGSGGCMNATLAYDLHNRTTTVTNSLGHVTTFHLNELGQVIRETNPLGHTTTSEWDRYDRLLARTDPLERTTRYAYDQAGNLVAVTRPDGSQTLTEYNELRLPIRTIDYDGAIWLRDYDQHGNLTTITNPLGAATRYTHNEHGHLTTITDALGNTHRIDTNTAGLPIMITNPRGGTTSYERDTFGRVVAITDPIGGITRLGWTIEGKLALRVQPDGASEYWTYDGEGNLIEYLDALGQLTCTEIGHFDLPTTQIGPDDARLGFGYDTELRLTSVTNPQGLVWRYDYDPAGNLIREADFNGRVLTYSHDAAGQLTERTNGAGQTIRYTRDLLGNIIKQHSTDTLATFAYDPAGRIVRAVNADADLIFQRDPLGQIVAETCNGRTLTSTYNSLGHRIHRRTPSGAESTWEYDTNSQPIALHTAGHTLRFTYDPAGRETQRHLSASTVLAQTWDANHHLLSQTLTTSEPSLKRPQSAHQTRLIQHRSYTYRPDGYPTTIHDHLTGTRRFDLDPTGRITTIHGAGWTERYAYDPAGNITHATWPTPPQTNQPDADAQGAREYSGTLIRRAGNIRYQHDTQGRIIIRQQKRLSAKPQTWHYTWNSDDRLIRVRTPDGTHWRYHYDPLGRRIAKQCLGEDNATMVEQIDFTWDGPILAEQTHTNRQPENTEPTSRTTTWNWQPNTFHPITQTQRTPLHDTPHDVRDAPQEWIDQKFYAIITDLIGTPTELIHPNGDIAWQPHTTLWGTAISQSVGTAHCPLRFPGQYFDDETKLHYNYHRYYDPTTARYETNDRLGLAHAPNAHTYVHNPTNLLDPFGLAPYDKWVDSGGVVRPLDDVPSIIWREGRPSPSNMGNGSEGLSFRDSLSNPYPTPDGMQPVFRREAYAIDTSKLPPGSVTPDGMFDSKITPPGHVTVRLGGNAEDAARILRAAEIRSLRQKFPR